MFLIIFPYPGVEKAYTFSLIDMVNDKDSYVDITYVLSDFLFAWMFMRTYFLVRTLLNFS